MSILPAKWVEAWIPFWLRASSVMRLRRSREDRTACFRILLDVAGALEDFLHEAGLNPEPEYTRCFPDGLPMVYAIRSGSGSNAAMVSMWPQRDGIKQQILYTGRFIRILPDSKSHSTHRGLRLERKFGWGKPYQQSFRLRSPPSNVTPASVITQIRPTVIA